MGAGQTFEIYGETTGGQENNTSRYFDLKIKWKDFCAGRKNKIAAEFDKEHSSEVALELTPVCKLEQKTKEELMDLNTGARIPTTFETLRLKFRTDHALSRQTVHVGGNNMSAKLEYELEPYHTKISGSDTSSLMGVKIDPLVLQGARISVKLSGIGDNDYNAKLWMDQGQTLIEKRLEQYNQIGLDITSKTICFLSKIFNVEETNPSHSQPTQFTLFGKTKATLMHSAGGGCLPKKHYAEMGDEKILRGYESDSSARRRFPSYLALKTDLYAKVSNKAIIPGIFLDTAIFECKGRSPNNHETASPISRSTVKEKISSLGKQTTLGLSLRFLGYRAELASPWDRSTPARIYIGMDTP